MKINKGLLSKKRQKIETLHVSKNHTKIFLLPFFLQQSQRDEIFFAQSAKKLSNDKILAVFLLLMMLSEVFFLLRFETSSSASLSSWI